MSLLEHPYEMIFTIDPTDFPRPTITLGRDGRVALLGEFPPARVTVLLVQDDDESVDITDQQYARMWTLIHYGMYLNACVEVHFKQCATLWGKVPRDFDGMSFKEILGGPLK